MSYDTRRDIPIGGIFYGMTEHNASWRTAITATLHCLTGCAIGEILGMVIGTAFGWSNAATVVLSIAVMELIDNAFVLVIPGAMAAGLTSALFWGSLAASLVLAFVVTVPVNRALISRGKGHAVVHKFHEHH